MKFSKLLLVPFAALLLSACGGGGTPSQTPSSEPTIISSEPAGESSQDESGSGPVDPEMNLILRFYLDYNHYEKEEPYYQTWWYLDRPFTKEQIGLVDPTEASDPFYPTFLGWSRYSIVDEEERLWKFGTDTVSQNDTAGGAFEIFGIFVGE